VISGCLTSQAKSYLRNFRHNSVVCLFMCLMKKDSAVLWHCIAPVIKFFTCVHGSVICVFIHPFILFIRPYVTLHYITLHFYRLPGRIVIQIPSIAKQYFRFWRPCIQYSAAVRVGLPNFTQSTHSFRAAGSTVVIPSLANSIISGRVSQNLVIGWRVLSIHIFTTHIVEFKFME
jgi:hypothetical protein